MYIYIEAVILDNFFITLVLALISYKALSQRVSIKRALLAATVSTGLAVTFPFINIHWGWLLLLRVATFILLSIILFFRKSKIRCGAIVFLVFTFVFGGAIFAVGLLVHSDLYAALTLPISRIPPGIFIGAALALYFVLKKVLRKLRRGHLAEKFSGKVRFIALNKDITLNAFLDTGNLLYDSKGDLPVTVLSTKASLALLGDLGLIHLLSNQIKKIDNSASFMTYQTANGIKSKMLVLKPKKFWVYYNGSQHRVDGVVLGLVLTKFSNFLAEYDALLHPAICNAMSNSIKLRPNPQIQTTQGAANQ